jgi:hypothetical protein
MESDSRVALLVGVDSDEIRCRVKLGFTIMNEAEDWHENAYAGAVIVVRARKV